MEYCHCGSLAALLKAGNRLNENELRDVASCCLFGLYYLQNRQIIHRVVDWCDD